MIRIKSNCGEICEDCQKRVIATHTTNRETNPTWDLTPYQGAGVGDPKASWRIFETSGGVEYGRGDIDETGVLVGLPDEFTSRYYYDGYMELQQGCRNPCCTEEMGCWDNISWP